MGSFLQESKILKFGKQEVKNLFLKGGEFLLGNGDDGLRVVIHQRDLVSINGNAEIVLKKVVFAGHCFD